MVNKRKSNIAEYFKLFETVLMCIVALMLIFYHISNGTSDMVTVGFMPLYIGTPFALIVIGLVRMFRESSKNKKVMYVIVAILVYIALRIVSGVKNELMSNTAFWITLCYEIFLLIGVNNATVNTRLIRIIFCSLIAFDLIAISICTFHYWILSESMMRSLAGFPEIDPSYLPFVYLFSNPNPAGMLSGITASACMLVFSDSSKVERALLAPVIVISAAFTIWTNCLSAIVGTGIILAVCIVRKYAKRINYKILIAFTLTVCIGLMIPVYVMALSSGWSDQLKDTEAELMLNDASSGRYNIWKEHILSQRGHYLLGFGTASNAIRQRKDYLDRMEAYISVNVDERHTMGHSKTLGAHNGYMEVVLAAGVPAALIVIGILFMKIRSMDNGFIDKHPIILLLVMLFWLNVVEARLITSSVHYIAFFIMLLLNMRDDERSLQGE